MYDGSCQHVLFAHKFTGKERDTESNLDNFGARYNSSSMGRFMSPDPMFMNDHHLYDPQELNLYSYVRNNPLSLTDPTGLDLWLKGCGKDTATCHKGYVGSWDKDHKHFTRTHLSGGWRTLEPVGPSGVAYPLRFLQRVGRSSLCSLFNALAGCCQQS